MNRRVPRLMRVAYAFLFCVPAISGCAKEPVSPVLIQTFEVDRESSIVDRATIIVPYDRLPHMPATFYMKTNHGETSDWKEVRVTRAGDSAVVRLAPIGKNDTPKAEDGAVVYYDDPVTAETDVSPPAFVLPYSTPAPQPVADADFSLWMGVYPNLVPWGWNVNTGGRTSYDLRPITAENTGVRISVASTPMQVPGAIATPLPRVSAAVALYQQIPLSPSHLRAVIRPFQPCRIEGGQVVVAAGVQVQTASGNKTLFCIGKAAYTGSAAIDGQKLDVTIVPGRIGDWNDVKFDLRSFRREADGLPVTVALVTDLNPAKSGRDWVTMDAMLVQSAK